MFAFCSQAVKLSQRDIYSQSDHIFQHRGGLPETEVEGDYMNYTNTNPAYTDLDITNVTEENVYSCLS